jgi:hypothetical protein
MAEGENKPSGHLGFLYATLSEVDTFESHGNADYQDSGGGNESSNSSQINSSENSFHKFFSYHFDGF